MRNAILTLLAATAAIAAYAHPISPGEAKSIASEFFNAGAGPKRAPKAVEMTGTDSKSQETQPYYIFNTEGDNGFVIVSGDTRAKKILGYSDKGSFSKDNIPPQLEWLLSQYEKSMETLPANAPSPRQNIKRTAEQNYLLTTQWGQGDPYNAKCPFVNGGRAVTGCVATAMAQIINYENKTSHVEAIPEYWCAVEMPALPPYEFNYGHLDNDGIATLMLYCGQSVRMDYGPLESGSAVQDVPAALRDYFGWEPEVRTLERDKYNDEHWNRMVREEIAKGHPLLYSAVGDQGWHAFVVDGYSDDLFHVNWGWDGNQDGFYSFQPFAQDHKSDFINMQWMVAVRDDDPSADIITYGTTINGINYELMDDLTAAVLPLKDGNKYRGDLVIPSHVDYEGKTYTVNYFGPNAFVNCEHLESIFIPATITGQEWSVFEGSENLHKVNVEDMAAFIRLDVGGWGSGSPLYYGGDLYLNGKLVKDLLIPEDVESIGYYKFANCWSIESVTMSSIIKYVGDASFAHCPNLKYVDMVHSSIEVLGQCAFLNDSLLEEISLPATLKTLEYKALGQDNSPGCEKLRKIVSLATTPPWGTADEIFAELQHSDAMLYVPDESIEEYRRAKEWSKFLEILPLSEEKPLPPTIIIIDGYFKYEINLTENYATIIGQNEYNYTNTIIPASINYNGKNYPVHRIAYWALEGMNLTSIEANLNKIGIKSFRNASFEDRLEIPSSLTNISRQAFLYAWIPYLVLPKELKNIGSKAFGHREKYDDKMENIIGYEKCIFAIESHNPNPPQISEDSFDTVTYEEVPLMVPYGTKKAYASAPGWCNFRNISNIGEEQEKDLGHDLTFIANLCDTIPIRDRMPLKISGTIRNSGTQKISGFKLSWLIDGNNLGEKVYDNELQPSESIFLEEKIIARVETAGMHELTLIISSDGVEDEDISDNEVSLPFESFDKGYYRVSLFEEFTTEACSLTPYYAPQIAEGIQYSGQSNFLAQVTHHCGFFEDFLTLNRDYEWFYGSETGGMFTPALMINRTDINETGNTPVFNVPNDLDRKIIKQVGICDALVSVNCEVEEDKVIVKTLLEKNEDFNLEDGYDYLTVFLLEDSIPSREQVNIWADGYAKDYIHRNTVRKILSETWGDRIRWDGDICAIKYRTDIDPSWNKDNLKAVAFIHRYDPTSPINCQVYTANSSDLSQYGCQLDDREYRDARVSSIILTQDNVTCLVGDSFNIEAIVVPDKVVNKDLAWSSDNEEIAVVNADGKITAVGVGVTTITVAAMDGSGVSASCQITVNPVVAESISINIDLYNATMGDSFPLTATILPENTTDKRVVWLSSNEDVAQIYQYYDETVVVITGIGRVVLTAMISDLTDSFELYCYPKIGDADWNGVITIADAVDIANFVVEKKTAPADWDAEEWRQFYIIGANANGSQDNEITFADAVTTVDFALDQPVYEAPSYMPSKSSTRVERSTDSLVVGDMFEKGDALFVIPVSLDNTMDYVALQADITLPEGMKIEGVSRGGRIASTHTLTTRSISDHSVRVALFDINNSKFINSDEPILEIIAKPNGKSLEEMSISNVFAVDQDAKEYMLSSGVSSTGVDVIQNEKIRIVPQTNGIHLYNAGSKEAIISTLDGRVIKVFVPESDSENIQLPSGIYIVKVAGEYAKCIVR